MQLPGANIASSIFGAAEAKQREAASKLRAKRQEPRPEIDRPEGDEAVHKVEQAEATRSAKGNDQEESREDREAAAGYGPHPDQAPPANPTIDLEG